MQYAVLAGTLLGLSLVAGSRLYGADEPSLHTYTYKKVGDLEIKADVYQYADERVRPGVVWIHGGALINGHRAGVSDPWGLTCCGSGHGGHLLDGVEGITNLGFLQPSELPDVFAAHGTFVLASSYEPWGVVIAEAAASGLPIVCSDACGAADELVREYYNGLVTNAGDAESLARALRWIHDHEDLLPRMGERGRALAEAFSATWDADSFRELERQLTSVAERQNRWGAYERLAARAGLDVSPPALWSLARLEEGDAPTSSEGLDELRTHGLLDGDGLTSTGHRAAERLAAAREARWSEVLAEWSPDDHPEVRELVERVRASFAAEPPVRG